MLNDAFLLSRGVRIREERVRLRLTQEVCAERCSVSRVQWGKYERGVTKLDGNVLKAFSLLGADAAYILSGQRDSPQTTSSQKTNIGNIQSQIEQVDAMLAVFKSLTPALKGAIRDIVVAVNVASEPLLKSAMDELNQLILTPQEYVTLAQVLKLKPQPTQPISESSELLRNKVNPVQDDLIDDENKLGQ